MDEVILTGEWLVRTIPLIPSSILDPPLCPFAFTAFDLSPGKKRE
jgi:hypothetical protein